MKLLYAQGACSFSVHILLEELGIPYEAQLVSIDKKSPELLKANPLGYVPVFISDAGDVITEAITILQYLSAQHPEKKLSPDFPSLHWAKCSQWLTLVSTELHQKLGPLFHPEGIKPEFMKEVKAKIETRLSHMDNHLINQKYLCDEYSIADMYALAILRISEHVGMKLDRYSALTRYKNMLEKMPAIARVIKIEQEAGNVKKSA